MPNKKLDSDNAWLIFVGVAIASGGVALYTPLIVSETGKAFSGFWAAAILFGLNLGRVLGSYWGSRYSAWANGSGAVCANILLEGVALYGMAYTGQAWLLALLALLAGIGSGLSFPGLKNALLRLKGFAAVLLFSRLSLAIRLGLVGGYLLASFVPVQHLKLVFAIVLLTFVVYAVFMALALRNIERREVAAARLAESAPALPAGSALPARFFVANALFWCLAVQPMIGYSLHIPKYTPDIPVSTPFWLAALVIILFQIPISRRATSNTQHFRFLHIGTLALLLSFALMCVFPHTSWAVVVSALLLAVGQVFYMPSFDVLLARFAEQTQTDGGALMSRQMVYQSAGAMIGSLLGGVLFDFAQFLDSAILNWLILCLLSLALLQVTHKHLPQMYRKASGGDGFE